MRISILRILSTPLLLTLSALPSVAGAGCDESAIREALGGLYGAGAEFTVSPAGAPGYCEVASGVSLIYVSEDGRYALQGPLYDTLTRENITERRAAGRRLQMLSAERPAGTFEFPARTQPASWDLTVVTDVDCAYCRKFHANMAAYNEAGIDVRYLIAPLGGKGSASYRKAVMAACSASPEETVTRMMSGEAIQGSEDCAHSIDEQLSLARRMGASSTPTFILPDGTLTSGFMPPERLVQVLEASGTSSPPQ